MRVWATEWDVFHCTPSRGGRGRRAAAVLWIDFVVCVFSVWWDFVFFFFVVFTPNARGLLQVQGNVASYRGMYYYYNLTLKILSLLL